MKFPLVPDEIGAQDNDYNMASINSNDKSPGDPPDKKLAVAEADAEKQPLSGVSINKQYSN